MQDDDKARMKQWVDNWKKTGPILRELWEKELQSPDYGLRLEAMPAIIDAALIHTTPRTSSGLVQQQKFFTRFRTQ